MYVCVCGYASAISELVIDAATTASMSYYLLKLGHYVHERHVRSFCEHIKVAGQNSLRHRTTPQSVSNERLICAGEAGVPS